MESWGFGELQNITHVSVRQNITSGRAYYEQVNASGGLPVTKFYALEEDLVRHGGTKQTPAKSKAGETPTIQFGV